MENQNVTAGEAGIKDKEVRRNAMIWFCAGVSMAEILTGTYFAPLGFAKGLAAILLGHLIGGVLFFMAGLIGAKTGKSAMETVKMSFGNKGALLFVVLNVVQLAGWTAVMILTGSSSCAFVFDFGASFIWPLLIGLLIIIWIAVDIRKFDSLNTAAFVLLFVLTIILCVTIFKNHAEVVGLAEAADALSFGAAVELSVAMPLSWLPLVSDYTRTAKKPVLTSVASSGVYFLVSCWMYFIGMGASILTGESDVVQIMVKAGLGIAALVIVIFSTVTTTFLDVYSAGISSKSISKKINEKIAAYIVCAVGVAIVIVISQKSIETASFENFLYFIGSVFAPMISIQIADYFIIKNDSSDKNFNILNLIIWVLGFVLYRFLMSFDFVLGSTFLVMLIVCTVTAIANIAAKKLCKK
ncbi:MAG: putative hydroxymethylpyrimidine transporter CytX [Spirochaetaceae bacterium]|nr:putative hydroxymethylpyrimidine transporter CytX [Spirochaetaceae bacterium]